MCGCGKVRIPKFLQQKKVMMLKQRQQQKLKSQQPQQQKPKHRPNPRQMAIRRMIQARNRMRNKRR